MLRAVNTGVQAIPRDNLTTVIDESYIAFGGLGPDLARLTRGGATTLAIDTRNNLPALTTLIDDAKPILDTQTETSDSIQTWASNLAQVTNQLQLQDESVQGLLVNGPPPPQTRYVSSSNGYSPPCPSCWPISSASGRWR